jgi:hypothetical protein
MRSIRVPLELTVRLVSAVEGVENTNASKPFKKFGERMQTPPQYCSALLAAFTYQPRKPMLPSARSTVAPDARLASE